jgi:hypothetical protein
MAVEAISRQQRTPTNETENASALRSERSQIMDQIRGYIDETFRQKGIAGESETRQLETWIRTQDASEEGVKSLREFYEGFLRKQLSSGRELYNSFYESMQTAQSNRWINQKSFKKWEERFRDKNVGYKARENWMKGDMAKYLAGWKKAAEERKYILQDKSFSALVKQYPEFADLKDESRFLDLHFDKRKSLVGAARGALKAMEKSQTDLYAQAKSKLSNAVSRGILGAGKEGKWLQRVFESSANPKKVEAFVNGSSSTSLSSLMQNWEKVRGRYDAVAEKFRERGADSAARGFKMIPTSQFLAMHYAQRVRYVEEAEQRLGDAKEVTNEQPIFLKIRHAMDMKDWNDAALLIAEAKTMHLKDADWPRLKSMERYVSQFKGKEGQQQGMEKGMEAKHRLDLLLQRFGQSHSEMKPLVERLLKSNHANRAIHQFRWVWYNNIWCRTHGPPYLSDDVARKGSSEDNEQLTKHRAEQGLDVGRHDVLDYETADHAYFRKQETAKHKATYLHTNVNSGGVQSALAEKMEREQDPKWLYWTTFCPHTDGEPKSEAWMREGLLILTEMRSLARTINGAGFRYQGQSSKMLAA